MATDLVSYPGDSININGKFTARKYFGFAILFSTPSADGSTERSLAEAHSKPSPNVALGSLSARTKGDFGFKAWIDAYYLLPLLPLPLSPSLQHLLFALLLQFFQEILAPFGRQGWFGEGNGTEGGAIAAS
jgi:hypothetical protein